MKTHHLTTLPFLTACFLMTQGCIFGTESDPNSPQDENNQSTPANNTAAGNNATTANNTSANNMAANNATTGNNTTANNASNSTSNNTTTEDPIAHLADVRPQLPAMLLDYSHDLPQHFRVQGVTNSDNTPEDNHISDAGATLGRVLFYDKRLSQNGTVACASCHIGSDGFSDPEQFSEGFDGGATGRNSMPLINIAYYRNGTMFWDQRADTLEDQVLMPIQDSVEMGLTLDELVERVGAADYYAPLFEDAFGDGEVTNDRISRALAQFVRSIVSYRSRWDEGIAAADGDITADFENYTAQENLGKEIFFGLDNPDSRGRCAACHMPNNPLAPANNGGPPRDNLALFQLARPTDNGLPDATDEGIGGVTGQQNQIGAFKSPTLRNIAQTGPYMHDGSLQTLGDVVDFYNMGIQDTPNLDPVLRAGGPGGPGGPGGGAAIQMNLTRDQRDALVAFLETLTDETLATDARFSNPFPRR